MKCNICGTESESGSLVFGGGFVCSQDCGQIALGKRKAYHDELLAESVGQMPDNLETGDFERWALKFALHFLRHQMAYHTLHLFENDYPNKGFLMAQ